MMSFSLARRGETPLSTWGELLDLTGERLCFSLERGAKNPDHVRIPAGTYKLDRKPLGASEFDSAFKALLGKTYKGILWLPDIPGRTNIELHTANWISELLGCISTASVIAKDTSGSYMAAFSKDAYRHIYPMISDAIDTGGAQLTITDIAV